MGHKQRKKHKEISYRSYHNDPTPLIRIIATINLSLNYLVFQKPYLNLHFLIVFLHPFGYAAS